MKGMLYDFSDTNKCLFFFPANKESMTFYLYAALEYNIVDLCVNTQCVHANSLFFICIPKNDFTDILRLLLHLDLIKSSQALCKQIRFISQIQSLRQTDRFASDQI